MYFVGVYYPFLRASISAPDLGILSHASYFIRIPGTNKIRTAAAGGGDWESAADI